MAKGKGKNKKNQINKTKSFKEEKNDLTEYLKQQNEEDRKMMLLQSFDDVRANMLNYLIKQKHCEDGCDFSGIKKRCFTNIYDLIDHIKYNAPALNYVVDQKVKRMFANGIVAGEVSEDVDDKVKEKVIRDNEALHSWLYSENLNGTTNYNVIQEATKDAEIYGKCGIRVLSKEDGLVLVDARHYANVIEDNTEYGVLKQLKGYIISEEEYISDIDITSLNFDKDEFERTGMVRDDVNKVIFLTKDKFINLRNNPAKLDGESPLLYEQQRIKLTLSALSRMVFEVEDDGVGRLALKLSSDFESSSPVSTTDAVTGTKIQTNEQIEKAWEEAEKIASMLKNSNSTDVFVISSVFDEVIPLPRQVTGVSLLEYTNGSEEMFAQIFGIRPALIGLGNISGNVSMEKIIDDGVLGDIVPQAEKYAIQFSSQISSLLGLEHIYFDKYNLTQITDNTDRVQRLSTSILSLTNAKKKTTDEKVIKMLDESIEILNKEISSLLN